MNKDYPMINLIGRRSINALIAWTVAYCLSHPEEISRAAIDKARAGNPGQRKAAAVMDWTGIYSRATG
jgi:hypothetical protein